MSSYLEHKASDPNAGDKAWDRVKEYDLADWLYDYEKQTEIVKNQTELLAMALKGMRQ